MSSFNENIEVFSNKLSLLLGNYIKIKVNLDSFDAKSNYTEIIFNFENKENINIMYDIFKNFEKEYLTENNISAFNFRGFIESKKYILAKFNVSNINIISYKFNENLITSLSTTKKYNL